MFDFTSNLMSDCTSDGHHMSGSVRSHVRGHVNRFDKISPPAYFRLNSATVTVHSEGKFNTPYTPCISWNSRYFRDGRLKDEQIHVIFIEAGDYPLLTLFSWNHRLFHTFFAEFSTTPLLTPLLVTLLIRCAFSIFAEFSAQGMSEVP